MRDRCLLQMRSAFEHLINRREHKCNGWGNFDQPQSREKKRSGSKRAETAERAARQQISIYLSRWDIWWHGTGEIWWENSHSSEHIGRTYHYVCWRSVGRLIHSAAFWFATVRARKKLFWWARALRKISLEHYRRESNVLIENVKSTASRKSRKNKHAEVGTQKHFAPIWNGSKNASGLVMRTRGSECNNSLLENTATSKKILASTTWKIDLG